MRSYPNRIPLSPAVVERITRALADLRFDRLYDDFGKTIDVVPRRPSPLGRALLPVARANSIT